MKQRSNPMPPPANPFNVNQAKSDSKQPKLNSESELKTSIVNNTDRTNSIGNKLFSNKRFQIFGFAGKIIKKLFE